MNIQEVKTVYTAGLEAILMAGADRVRKHNRKNDVDLFMERGNYWVHFTGPCDVCYADGTCKRNVVSVNVKYWHTMDLSEEGHEVFDNTKDAIRFLKSAVCNPKRVLKKIETWYNC